MRFSSYKKTGGIEHVIDLNNLEIFHPENNKRIKLVKDNRSILNKEGYWEIFPIGFSTGQVYIVCPHCGEIHVHGRNGHDYKGHRASHCVNKRNTNGYIIQEEK